MGSPRFGDIDVGMAMTAILACMASTLGALLLTLRPKDSKGGGSTWLACAKANPAKRAWEVFNLRYAVFWVGCFAAIIGFSLYEDFDEVSYMVVCFGLSLPIVAFPLVSVHPSEEGLAVGQRYGVRANVWIAIYSFIGNYWYTHYFYCVLGAKYTFPSWRLNDVPIPLIAATVFYFSLYHALSNMAIRKVVTSFEATTSRTVTLVTLVGVMSYAVAFTETLTISGFPYYEFEDRDMAYVVGSAFYGIYFIVSFPMFYAFDEWPQEDENKLVDRRTGNSARGLWGAAVDSLGASMLILCLLDFVRLAVGSEFFMKG
ncbi:unnamed protein product [Ectocarpus sp. 13 AM-2016]